MSKLVGRAVVAPRHLGDLAWTPLGGFVGGSRLEAEQRQRRDFQVSQEVHCKDMATRFIGSRVPYRRAESR